MTAPLVRKMILDMVSIATGADAARSMGQVEFAATVTDVTFVPNAAATGGAIANSRIYTLYNRGQSPYTGTVAVATFALTSSGAVNFVDNTPQAMTLNSTSANKQVAAGDVLEFESLHRTTGQDDPGGRVVVTLSRN
jgi:hypothetical protein